MADLKEFGEISYKRLLLVKSLKKIFIYKTWKKITLKAFVAMNVAKIVVK